MSWKEHSIVSQREEFVRLCEQEGANIRQLCRRFGISPTTAYKWLRRFKESGRAGLEDRSLRPHGSPLRTEAQTEARIVALRQEHPSWGARTLKTRLETRDATAFPAVSTVHAVLKRHALLDPVAAASHTPWQRFEHPEPNDLWQMDFKGHFGVEDGCRCHPLTVLDDHSRFCVALRALPCERGEAVKAELEKVFRRYGLPRRLLADNGAPWGSSGQPGAITALELWLLDVGVQLIHGRPLHPQTQGKDERFHRTLKVELLQGRTFPDVAGCQPPFDRWRDVYNQERPHRALGLLTPGTRFTPSPRSFPEVIAPPEYDTDDVVRKVQDHGWLHFKGICFRVGTALKGRTVAVRASQQDGAYDVYYRYRCIATLDFTDSQDLP